MMVGAFAIAGGGGIQDQRYGGQQCCQQQQNPLAEMIRTILQRLGGMGQGHGPHGHQGQHGQCAFNQGNPNFGANNHGHSHGPHGHNHSHDAGSGAFAAVGRHGAVAGAHGDGLNHALAARDPFGGGIAASGHAGEDGISHALAIKDPFGGGISVSGSAGKGGLSHGLSLKLPFGGPSLSLGGSIGGLLG